MSDDDTLKPREDLSDRYLEIIKIQTESIRNFDDKTWRTMRLTGIIAGVGVGSVSILSRIGNGSAVPQSPVVRLGVSISILLFVGAFALGLRSYQSAELSTAPQTELGTRIKDSEPKLDDYRSTLVEGYSDAVEQNKTVLQTKKQRFKLTLAAVFVGIWILAIVFFLLVWTPELEVAYLVLVFGLVIGELAAFVTLYWDSLSGNEESQSDEGNED